MWIIVSLLLFFTILVFGLVGFVIVRLIVKLFEEDLEVSDNQSKAEICRRLGEENVVHWT